MSLKARPKMRGFLIAGVLAGTLFPLGRMAFPDAVQAGKPARPFVAVALGGTVMSDKDGPMEGVLLIAKRDNDPMLVSVVTDAAGRYAFPSDRLAPGRYSLTVRAVGYDLPGNGAPVEVEVGPNGVTRDIRLQPVADTDQLASQLTSLEWLNSFPGTDAQKTVMMRNMVNCAFCHSFERIARSGHDSKEFLEVMQRMLTYETDHSGAERIQIVASPQPVEGLQWFGRKAKDIADYLATVNLSGGKETWAYPLKTLPRPSGIATKAVVTVYPIPRETSVIHDLDVDSKGNVWYGNSGWDYIGKLDPKTGAFGEWESPNFLPPAAPGTDRILGVQDIQVDGDDNVWVAVGGNKLAKFMPSSASWQTYDMPVVWKNPFLGPVRPGETGLWVTGLGAMPEGDKRHEQAFRLDIRTGELSKGITLFDDLPPPADPDHINPLNYCYMMDQDLNGDFLCTAPERSAIARAERATGKVRMVYTPTPFAYPRRGYRDPQNRFWFGEFYADKIGMVDLNSDKVTEYPVPVKFIQPYYARPDAKGHVWVSSTGSDRLLRLDPKTGEVVQYLMPVPYDARKVVVDVRADRTTVWLPNKNRAELIRVEIPD